MKHLNEYLKINEATDKDSYFEKTSSKVGGIFVKGCDMLHNKFDEVHDALINAYDKNENFDVERVQNEIQEIYDKEIQKSELKILKILSNLKKYKI